VPCLPRNLRPHAATARLATLLAVPSIAAAQEATIAGTLPIHGGVSPVSSSARSRGNGNSFEAVTDERGTFRLPVRVGVYRIQSADRVCDGDAHRGAVLVGQEARVTLQMAPATLQESVTVTGETPWSIRRARRSAPTSIRGRCRTSAAGSQLDGPRAARARQPPECVLGVPEERQAFSQINVDGQQVTNLIASTDSDQPKYSRDSIAEFEIISNRFDARQGRSSGSWSMPSPSRAPIHLGHRLGIFPRR